MRKLNTADALTMARIIKKANLKELISGYIKAGAAIGNKKSPEARELGVDIAGSLLELLANEDISSDFVALLAGVSEKTPSDILAQSLDATVELIQNIVSGAAGDFSRFFKFAGQLPLK